MSQKEEELYELPEWVKLVNSLINKSKRLSDENEVFNKGSGTQEVKSE